MVSSLCRKPKTSSYRARHSLRRSSWAMTGPVHGLEPMSQAQDERRREWRARYELGDPEAVEVEEECIPGDDVVEVHALDQAQGARASSDEGDGIDEEIAEALSDGDDGDSPQGTLPLPSAATKTSPLGASDKAIERPDPCAAA